MPENKSIQSEARAMNAEEVARKKAIEDAKKGEAMKKSAEISSYTPKENEKGLYHVKLDRPAFDPKSGQKISKSFIQKFTKAEWSQFEKNSTGLGYTIEVVWNPEAKKL